MFDVSDFVQEINPVQAGEKLDVTAQNRQHLAAIASYKNLTPDWDGAGAVAPDHQTVVIALDLALLVIAAGQSVYHTTPGPAGEIMVNLRTGEKSLELLVYPGDRRKFVCIGPNEQPRQGPLTPNTLWQSLQWLNQ